MKYLLASLFVLLPVKKTFASFDMQCGLKPNGWHSVDLHIEDDSVNPPEEWVLRVDGKRPFSLRPAVIEVKRKKITVILNSGGDSAWVDYIFQVPDSCDSETYNGRVGVYQRTVSKIKYLYSYRCNCIED